jgi:hypothetical protein
MNLAAALAQAGSRVLLVEADLRHPRCHRIFGVYNSPGLSEFLTGANDDLDGMVREVNRPGSSSCPPARCRRTRPSSSGRHACTTRSAGCGSADFVVLDTPPTLPVTDAAVLAGEADGVVLVIKGTTRRASWSAGTTTGSSRRARSSSVCSSTTSTSPGAIPTSTIHYGYRATPETAEKRTPGTTASSKDSCVSTDSHRSRPAPRDGCEVHACARARGDVPEPATAYEPALGIAAPIARVRVRHSASRRTSSGCSRRTSSTPAASGDGRRAREVRAAGSARLLGSRSR